MKETKTFSEWLQQTKTKTKQWDSKHRYVAIDIDTLKIHYFNSMKEIARRIGIVQIHTHQYDALEKNNNGCGSIIGLRYRVFTESFFNRYRSEIDSMPRYINESLYSKEYMRLSNAITINKGEIYLYNAVELSLKIGLNVNIIRSILRGETIKNDFNIRYCNFSHEYKHELAIKHSNKVSRSRSKKKYKILD